MANIKVSLGGYVAEKLKVGTTSDGVASDFQQAMKTAHAMVWKYGMSSMGFVGDYTTLLDTSAGKQEVIKGGYLSDKMKEELNNEVQKIFQQCLPAALYKLDKY